MGDKLLRLSSGDILPNIPELAVNTEVRKYLKDLHDYLRRLAGRFTAENIAQSGGALGVIDHWVHVTGNNSRKVYATSQDMRGKFFWVHAEYIATTDTLSGSAHADKELLQWSNATATYVPLLFGVKWNPGVDFSISSTWVGGASINLYLESGTGKIYYTITSYSAPCEARVEILFGPSKTTQDADAP